MKLVKDHTFRVGTKNTFVWFYIQVNGNVINMSNESTI